MVEFILGGIVCIILFFCRVKVWVGDIELFLSVYFVICIVVVNWIWFGVLGNWGSSKEREE